MNVPERIGKYVIQSVLGRGAMGVVYRGFDPGIQRPVAIKTIHRSLLGDDQQAQDSITARFRNEAQAVGRIAHPGVVAIYEYGEDGDTAFIAMEYVEGRNLDQVLAGRPLLPDHQVLHIMEQLLDALAQAHSHGVWHRDIKPANLIISAGGLVKLTDFGIARIENLGLTTVNSSIGTPGYMAPEQYLGETVDHRADIFACGVLLYRMLAGQAPFSGTTESVMYKIFNEVPTPPSAVTSGLRHSVFDALVQRAMARRAEDRYPSAQAFKQALFLAAHAVGVSTEAAAGAPAGGDDATVVMTQQEWAQTLAAASAPPPSPVSRSGASGASGAAAGSSRGSAVSSPSQGGSLGAAPPTGWDAQALSRIEKVLAPYVGPMARVMVRDAARQCSDLASLAQQVARHIERDQDRTQFMSAVTASGSAIRPSTGVTVPPLAEAPTQVAGAGVDEQTKAHAERVLTRHLGPIAKVLVKRSAASARDRAHFHQLLLAAAADVNPEQLRKELEAD